MESQNYWNSEDAYSSIVKSQIRIYLNLTWRKFMTSRLKFALTTTAMLLCLSDSLSLKNIRLRKQFAALKPNSTQGPVKRWIIPKLNNCKTWPKTSANLDSKTKLFNPRTLWPHLKLPAPKLATLKMQLMRRHCKILSHLWSNQARKKKV